MLATTSAQYKFLQILANSYAYMLANMQSARCMINPHMFINCTDYDAQEWIWFMSENTALPTASYLSPNGTTANFDYSAYSTVSWGGFNASTFPAANITIAATAVLFAACGANSTCTESFETTPNATQVVESLVKTNVNTIVELLAQNPTSVFIPWGSGHSFLANMYGDTPDAATEVFGVHNAAVQAMAAGKVNATTYINQFNLGEMMNGGFAMYEVLLHTAILGSWTGHGGNVQANINMTAPQLFTSYTTPGLDTRSIHHHQTPPHRKKQEPAYKTKWDVWLAEASGTFVPNKSDIFASIESRVRDEIAKSNSLNKRYTIPPYVECASSQAETGIAWLSEMDTACSDLALVTGVLSLSTSVATALAAKAEGLLTSAEMIGLDLSFATVLTGQVASLCGSQPKGYPCYPGTSAWQVGGGLLSVVSVLVSVVEYSSPLGEALAFANLFCGLAGVAEGLYSADLKCCKSDCLSPSCLSNMNGCTQGTGVC